MMTRRKDGASTPVVAAAAVAAVVVLLAGYFLIAAPSTSTSSVPSEAASTTPVSTTFVSISQPSLISSTVLSITEPSVSSSYTSQASTTSSTIAPSSSSATLTSLSTGGAGSGTSSTSSSSGGEKLASCSIFQNLWDPSQGYDVQAYANFGSLFGNYTEMGVSYSEAAFGTTTYLVSYTTFTYAFNGTTGVSEQYNVVYASPTTYKVNIGEVQEGAVFNATAWVLKNGTVVAYSYLGQNLTGSVATGIYQGLMAPFVYETDYSGVVQPFTSVPGVQAQSKGSLELGSTTVGVTSYTATTLPLTVQVCGSNFMLSSYSLQTGEVQGTKTPLLTLLNVAGAVTYNDESYPISGLYVQLTSVQRA